MAEEVWKIEPSGPLRGDIHVRGSKNAVTKHMVAAMLGEGESVIRNAPEVGDVEITGAMLAGIPLILVGCWFAANRRGEPLAEPVPPPLAPAYGD